MPKIFFSFFYLSSRNLFTDLGKHERKTCTTVVNIWHHFCNHVMKPGGRGFVFSDTWANFISEKHWKNT